MTDDTPMTPVKGYTPQPQERLDWVNKNQEAEERLIREAELFRQARDADPRWVAIAITHFQEGFMALNRAIMKPQRVRLPEDEQD